MLQSLAFLTIDADSDVPVYRQIADAVLRAARDGRLDPGRRLPPTRDLARRLGVNRQTVVAAYDVLASEGHVRSHTGRGTFLVSTGPGDDRAGAAPPTEPWLPSFSRAVDGPRVEGLRISYQAAAVADGISFAGSYPAADLLPTESFARAVDAALRESTPEVLMYGPTAGHGPFRERIAADMRVAGSLVGTDDILITNGAQQAIDLVFHTFLERGDTVVLEEPTYTGALSSLGSIGARVVSVPVDERGIRTDLLAIALERHRPRLLYVQPTFQNPTTAVMGERRRHELLELAERNRCLVVEDDWANGLRLDGDPLPTLHAMDGGRRVIYLSTFSKKLLPGVRVGWIAAPEPVLQKLVTLKQIRDCGTSPLLQAALHSFLEGGGLEEHLQRVLPANRARRDAMADALQRHLPATASWTVPPGGLFMWVTLPREIDSRRLLEETRRVGVRFSSGDVFHAETQSTSSMRLTYSAAGPSHIDRGVAAIGAAIRRRQTAGEADRRRGSEAVPIL